MPVHQVSDTPILKPDQVYVIAPDQQLVLEGNNIASHPFPDTRGQRAPIDMFFRSVANGRGDGIAVVLSGAGSDGALGIRAMKEAGAVVFVQDPADAEFQMMPRSAVATGVADFVAPIPRLVERLIEVVQSKDAVRSLSHDIADRHLQGIVGFLRARTGHDFSRARDGDASGHAPDAGHTKHEHFGLRRLSGRKP
ncbi:chemotaxis protein CheB [Paracoccus albicereus]|uniref:chemotaxis protein CheB n=1 Tax=Paracoccus albicereus TaxID=2922394 RepID=UPI0021011220|nr:chemotaxis protein CheB [Paracoccus albicereus]